ncbi:hypothetical protein TorRG33x02_122130 [Trema orientale]|uniref:Uncharacterized protein n=1 Tax=Trema orientale TaxID=63057 RepID=A0A2P5F278_TREOI|nr:hypothetical protein TorRG33x02_122130 [Trema orientale]
MRRESVKKSAVSILFYFLFLWFCLWLGWLGLGGMESDLFKKYSLGYELLLLPPTKRSFLRSMQLTESKNLTATNIESIAPSATMKSMTKSGRDSVLVAEMPILKYYS